VAAIGVATRRVPLSATVLWTLALLTFLSIFAMPSLAQTADLVIAPVDPASRVVLRGQRAPWALPQNSQGPVPGDTMLEHLTLVLKRSPQRQKVFEQFLQQQQDPASPHYHRWLTPIQIGKRFGASQHDIEAVSEWLRTQGLRVDSVANSRMLIDFSGTASLVGAAFATAMRYYLVAGEQRMASAYPPQIPAALAGVIQSVSSLSTNNDRPYFGAGQASLDLPAATFCSGSCNYIFPSDFSTIYDLNSVYGQGINGAGQTIAIIGRAKVYNPDVENFESLAGLAKKDPTVIVPPGGVDPGAPAGTGGLASSDQFEATLDVLRSTSVAPGATIDLIVSANTNTQSGLRIAAQYAVDTSPVPAQIMNISFGACEADRTQADVQFWDTLFSAAAAEGISVFVASGDAGAAGCDPNFQTPPATQIASPNYICSSSYSTCVGGTEFADAANPSAYWNPTNGSGYESALSYIPEGGWNEPFNSTGATRAAASGGGVSAYIATPSWQTGTGVPGTQGRYTPDIAFSASGHDGYFGCLAASGGTHPSDCVLQSGSFHFEYFFGTSAAAPDMAGITALLNQKFHSAQGELNPRLYQLASTPANAVFHDVTVTSSGVTGCVGTTPSMCNNSTPSPTGLTGGLSGYLVTPGFDEVTGLGSIDGANLLANWVASATFTISATPASQTISSGGIATIAITVTQQGNYSSPISFAATLTPTSAAQISFNPATITPSSGITTTTLTIQGATSGTARAAYGATDRLKPSALHTSVLWTPIGVAGFLLLGRRKKRDWRVVRLLLLSATLGLIALIMFSCGGGSSSPPPPPTQTYQVQITATAPASPDGSSGAVTTSKTVSFTAQ
jgi:pseudomonalisin